jgi:hypothetical protein
VRIGVFFVRCLEFFFVLKSCVSSEVVIVCLLSEVFC